MDLGSSKRKLSRNQAERFLTLAIFKKISLRFLKKWFLFCGSLLYAVWDKIYIAKVQNTKQPTALGERGLEFCRTGKADLQGTTKLQVMVQTK